MKPNELLLLSKNVILSDTGDTTQEACVIACTAELMALKTSYTADSIKFHDIYRTQVKFIMEREKTNLYNTISLINKSIKNV